MLLSFHPFIHLITHSCAHLFIIRLVSHSLTYLFTIYLSPHSPTHDISIPPSVLSLVTSVRTPSWLWGSCSGSGGGDLETDTLECHPEEGGSVSGCLNHFLESLRRLASHTVWGSKPFQMTVSWVRTLNHRKRSALSEGGRSVSSLSPVACCPLLPAHTLLAG